MKVLDEILNGIEVIRVSGDTRVMVSSITSDSGKAGTGAVFVAVKGTRTDGHLFINQAVSSGAVVVVCEKAPPEGFPGVVTVTVPDSAAALGYMASAFWGNPSASLRLVGVTGTNGKTTIATLLYRMFTELGYKCGLLSTVCNYVHERQYEASHTTPDPVALNGILAEMVDAGCEYAFMEVSSHASDQKRIAGIEFSGGIFTNLTHDHLDYHKTFDNYLAAKKRFFDGLGSRAFALVNADDRNSRVMIQNCRAAVHSYSLTRLAEYRASVSELRLDGMSLNIGGREVWTPFLGGFNASNLLAVYAASRLLGAAEEEALRVLSALTPVAGRLEIIRSEEGITGLVDYAHTPDALKNVTDTINRVRMGSVKLITVIGAGGDRDRTKRPLMASIAAAASDVLILTSDNPRTEDQERILDEMEAGLNSVLRKKMMRIADRRSAIRTGVRLAVPGDIVLVAGKGHETYQEINGIRHHFDDREELRNAFMDLNL
ncbi:MAG: UDP-N-acetylmuramoyl-L-alanyl-D-glutamate--2,6-diaminopimelate ligase [Bacteroidetes bacterium]|nr:UDP-N-acetylmuramoyl-L-alanyl-D-glutamate--2,6-diaminopimelate ligase [Bacteroidota bacterium]